MTAASRQSWVRGLSLFFVKIIGITAISFAIIHLAPGDAVEVSGGLNAQVSREAREKLTRLYGLDRPVHERYAHWLRRVLCLDFGRSLADGQPVIRKIASALPITLGLNLLTLAVILAAGVALGVWAAARAGKAADRAVTLFVMAGHAAPTFWLSLMLMAFFGVQLRWLPVSGLVSVDHQWMSGLERFLDVAAHLVLPVLVASLTGLAGLSRLVRAGLLEALRAPYARAARARGLNESAVLWRHALPNALLPVVTVLGLSVPGLLGGSVVFETIFSIPGMGRLFFASVFSRDYPVVMGILVLGALFTLASNAAADWAYSRIDPRIRR